MPYFLNAPASIATNNGDCSSDTAGTATLMIFNGVSAANVANGDNKKIASENSIVHRFIVAPVADSLNSDYSKREKMSRSSWYRTRRLLILCAATILKKFGRRRARQILLCGAWPKQFDFLTCWKMHAG